MRPFLYRPKGRQTPPTCRKGGERWRRTLMSRISVIVEFYRSGHRRGPEETELRLPSGLAVKIDTFWWARRSVHDQFPWYLPGFSGTMFIAVGIPILTTFFWVLVLYALFNPHANMRWLVLGLAGGLMLTFMVHFVAGRLVPAPLHEGPADPGSNQ